MSQNNETDNIKTDNANKCPSYILIAANKYYKKKCDDPEYITKEKLRLKKYYEEHKEEIKQKVKERRAKTKNETIDSK